MHFNKTLRWIFAVGVMIISLINLATPCMSQTVIISEDVIEQRQVPDFGVNRKHFRHFYTGFHFLGGPAEDKGADINYLRSWRFEVGHRYKRKFSEIFSAGYDLSIKRDAFHINQESGKLIPDTISHDREKLVFLSTGIGVYQRMNFGRRGNHMGRFLDLGMYGEWNIHVRNVTFDRIENERIRTRRSGLSYPENFGYGAIARLGSGKTVIKFSYRMSDLFRASEQLPELPGFSAGIEIGMHP